MYVTLLKVLIPLSSSPRIFSLSHLTSSLYLVLFSSFLPFLLPSLFNSFSLPFPSPSLPCFLPGLRTGLPRRSSCPSAIHADSSQVRFVDDDLIINPSMDGASSGALLLSSPAERDVDGVDPADRPRFHLRGDDDRDDDDDDDAPKTEKTDVAMGDSGGDFTELQRLGRKFDNAAAAPTRRSADTLEEGVVDNDDDVDDDEEVDTDANSAVTGNSSHPTTSGMTSSTDRFPIDFSNRAKLPRGVVNVRPHLEKVDMRLRACVFVWA